MTEEEQRAIAYQDQFAKRAAFRAQMQKKLLGNPQARLQLFLNQKAMTGEVPQDDGQDRQDDGRGGSGGEGTIANL